MGRPTLVYDDDCGFCTWCAAVAGRSGEFDLVGFAEVGPALRERLPADYEDCVHLLTDDAVYSCGEATERALARMNGGADALASFLALFPGYPTLRERGYRWAADRRDWWGRLASRDGL